MGFPGLDGIYRLAIKQSSFSYLPLSPLTFVNEREHCVVFEDCVEFGDKNQNRIVAERDKSLPVRGDRLTFKISLFRDTFYFNKV